MVWEVVDNSVDEALAGHADTVHVTLLADGGVRVEDNGRGIPVDMHPVEKRPDGRGRHDHPARGRQVRRQELRGLRRSARRRRHRRQRAVDAASRSRSGGTAPSGTSTTTSAKPGAAGEGRPDEEARHPITFWADADIFETTTYSFETISRRLQEMAFLNKGLTIVLRDERPGHSKVETGMAEEISLAEAAPGRHEARPSRPPRSPTGTTAASRTTSGTSTPRSRRSTSPSSSFSADGVGKNDMAMRLDVAMQWYDAYSESVYTFANTINTHEGGTHEEGFRAALTSIVNHYARGQGAPQGEGRRSSRARTSARVSPRSSR